MKRQKLCGILCLFRAKVNVLFLFLFFVIGCNVDDENGQEGSFFLKLSPDFSITSVTKAATKATEEGPSVDDFKVEVYQGETGTTPFKKWDSFSTMGSEVHLSQGIYRLKAYYGEQHKGAFETPYYEGSNVVSIVKKKQTAVSVVCKIANTKVTLEYSDGFKQYFKDWTVKVASTGDSLTFAKDETRGAYFQPGQVGMNLVMTRQDGKTLQYAPPVIATEGGKHYRVRLDVTTGGAGGVNLIIKFDKTTEEKPIYVDISGDNPVIVSPPYISSTGFSSGMPITVTEGTSAGKIYTLVNARGKIKSCVLRTDSRSLLDNGWPEKVDLADATANVSGLKGITFTSGMKGAQMAEIDFTELMPVLPASNQTSLLHTFFLEVTDEAGKKNDEFTLMAQMSVPGFRLLNLEGVDTSNGTALIRFEMTSGDVEKIVVEAKNDYGIWSKLDWKEKPKLTNVTNIYSGVITIKVEDKKDVRLNYNNGARISNSSTLYGGNYTFELEMADGQPADPAVNPYVWATKAYIKVKNAYISPYKLSFRKDSKDGDELETEILMDNTILIKGLDAGTENRVVAVVKDAVAQSKPFVIKTDKNIQLPNSNFENQWIELEYGKDVPIGGRKGYNRLFSKPVYGEADTKRLYDATPSSEWANINKRTMPQNPKTLNTWYVVPSCLKVNKDEAHSGEFACLIRNVKWNNWGNAVADNTPKLDTGGGRKGTPIPPKIGNINAVGRLFLGSYRCEHKIDGEGLSDEETVEGYPFTSRPGKLAGWYRYNQKGDNTEKGKVEIALYKGEELIAHGSQLFVSTNSDGKKYLPFEVEFKYNSLITIPDRLTILFLASEKQDSEVYVSENIYYDKENKNALLFDATVTNPNAMTFTGNELYIDDLKLIYE